MKNITKQKKKKEKIDYSRFFDEIKKHKFSIIVYLILTFGEAVLNIYTLTVLSEAITQITNASVNESVFSVILYFSLTVLSHLLIFIMCAVILKTFASVARSLSIKAAKRVYKVNSQSYDKASTGNFIDRISQSSLNMFTAFWDLIESVVEIFKAVIIVAYIMYNSLILGFCFLIFFVIMYFVNKYKTKVQIKYTKKYKQSEDEVCSHINEIVRSEKDIKALNLEEHLKIVTDNAISKKIKDFHKNKITNLILYRSSTTMFYVLILLIMLFAIFLQSNNLIDISIVIFLIVNIGTIKNIAEYSNEISTSCTEFSVATKRYNDIFDEEIYQLETFGNENFETDFQGNVTFKNVCFGYTDDKLILDNVSLTIPQGKTVAFVGMSGSGKSTIVSLLAKLYNASSGEILLDDYNIDKLSKQAIRSNIALITQFPYLFDNTIKENLMIAKSDATNKEIEDVIEKANLKEFIESLPQGINTIIGENGVKLSGGQKQRIAIARALLKPSKLIIFDESTSSLDNFSQAKIQNSIDELKGKKTIILVAHRLTTIKNADIVFYISNGKVVAQGSFNELFNNNEEFRNLFYAENLK